jgi:hypothetical protein
MPPPEEEYTPENIQKWFCVGREADRFDDCPYESEDAQVWWTRGYIYSARERHADSLFHKLVDLQVQYSMLRFSCALEKLVEAIEYRRKQDETEKLFDEHHEHNLRYEVYDQTLGVTCVDCDMMLGVEWGDDVIDFGFHMAISGQTCNTILTAVKLLEETRWNPDGSMSIKKWSETASEGKNWARVQAALDLLRRELNDYYTEEKP